MPSKVLMLTLETLVGGTPAFARKPAYVVWVESVIVRGQVGDPFSRADYQVEIRRREDVRAFRALKEKQEKSRRQPGPPLTGAEAARLQTLQDEVDSLERSIRASKRQRKALLATIVGHTRKVTSNAKTVSFGSKPVLTIYAGDLLQVKVVDKDLFNDDVYGSHVYHVTADALQAGAVELGRTAGISALRLRFRPADR